MPVTTEIREENKLDLAAEVLSAGGVIRLRALGASMLPSIWPGDVLTIENKPGEEAVPGDIVLIARDSRFFIHRLIEKQAACCITRGDSLPHNDPPVSQGQLLGKVSAIHRGKKVIVPNPRVSLWDRTLAWMLCHWRLLRNVALRIHFSWQKRVPRNANSMDGFAEEDGFKGGDGFTNREKTLVLGGAALQRGDTSFRISNGF